MLVIFMSFAFHGAIIRFSSCLWSVICNDKSNTIYCVCWCNFYIVFQCKCVPIFEFVKIQTLHRRSEKTYQPSKMVSQCWYFCRKNNYTFQNFIFGVQLFFKNILKCLFLQHLVVFPGPLCMVLKVHYPKSEHLSQKRTTSDSLYHIVVEFLVHHRFVEDFLSGLICDCGILVPKYLSTVG